MPGNCAFPRSSACPCARSLRKREAPALKWRLPAAASPASRRLPQAPWSRQALKSLSVASARDSSANEVASANEYRRPPDLLSCGPPGPHPSPACLHRLRKNSIAARSVRPRLHKLRKNSEAWRLVSGHDFTGCGKTPRRGALYQATTSQAAEKLQGVAPCIRARLHRLRKNSAAWRLESGHDFTGCGKSPWRGALYQGTSLLVPIKPIKASGL